jgi:hypothetical protein
MSQHCAGAFAPVDVVHSTEAAAQQFRAGAGIEIPEHAAIH